MTQAYCPSSQGLHSELIACVLAHLSFDRQKIQLKVVCSVWRDALQLPAAHPPKSFDGSFSRFMDPAVDYQLLGGVDRVRSLHVTLSYFRQPRGCWSLPSLNRLEVKAEDDYGAVHLPHLPNLRHMTLIADQSGHQLLQTGLLKLATLNTLRYVSGYEGDDFEDIPVICVPPQCDVTIEMIDACFRAVPAATSKNLTKLAIGLSSNVFPDLRSCERLTHIQFWLDELHAPGPHPNCMQGMGNLPGAVEFVRLVRIEDDVVCVEDWQGYCHFRGYHDSFGWCTCILSVDKFEAVGSLCTSADFFGF